MTTLNPTFRQLDMTIQFNNIENNQTKSTYNFIDLFAGIGGIRLGFEEVFKDKCSFVFASEIDKFAQQTYASNYNHLPSGDITKIEPQEIPSFDILLAGFPCQPFSNAGLKKGFADTRGTLFFDIVRIAKYHKPQVLFLENVKGFKNHDKGNTFRVVKETLEELGYRVFSEVLNAKHFGVPQNRERIYIIAFLDHINYALKLKKYKWSPISSKIILIEKRKYINAVEKLKKKRENKLSRKKKREYLNYVKKLKDKREKKPNIHSNIIKRREIREESYLYKKKRKKSELKIYINKKRYKQLILPYKLNLKDFNYHWKEFCQISTKKFVFPKPFKKNIKLGDILEKKVDKKYTISDKLWAGHQRRKLEHKKKGNGFGYCIFTEESEYTSTISARYYKDGSEILIEQTDKNPRKLSPREAGRLQGFPDDFKIVVSDTQAYKQFGNSVAVPVIKAIAKEIYKWLK